MVSGWKVLRESCDDRQGRRLTSEGQQQQVENAGGMLSQYNGGQDRLEGGVREEVVFRCVRVVDGWQ